MTRPGLALLAAVPCLLATAATAAPHGREGPRISNAWARPAMGAAGMSAVYLDIEGGAAPDRLTGASAPGARLALHRSGAMAEGMTGMSAVAEVAIPARGVVRLAPGGLHLMVTRARPLRAGARLPVTLRFAHAGAVTVQAPVRATPPGR